MYKKRWCPNGCGKSVYYLKNCTGYERTRGLLYFCERCKEKFTPEEMKNT